MISQGPLSRLADCPLSAQTVLPQLTAFCTLRRKRNHSAVLANSGGPAVGNAWVSLRMHLAAFRYWRKVARSTP